MRLATWNINSLQVRQPRVEEWLADVQPDIVCMQETKLPDDGVPGPRVRGARLHDAPTTARASGTAWPSCPGSASTDVVAGFADGEPPDPEARLISATCGGIRVSSVYVPNGRGLDQDHYQYKLQWLARLRRHVAGDDHAEPAGRRRGDFNIAPTDIDVYDPTKFVDTTHTSPPEREALAALEGWGLDDVFRRHYDAGSCFSWWDYRAGDFHQGRGMRIDLVLATAPVAAALALVRDRPQRPQGEAAVGPRAGRRRPRLAARVSG